MPFPRKYSPENIERAERARQALATYSLRMGYRRCEAETSLVDLLTDLKHYCWLKRWDFEEALKISAYHFEAERQGKS